MIFGRAKAGGSRIPGLALGLALVLGGQAAAAGVEALRAATVKITVSHSGAVAPGSGIVLCQRGTRVEILTAKHVLTGLGLFDEAGAPAGERFRDVRSTEIAFYHNNPLPLRFSPGDPQVVVQKDEYKDLALITLEGIEARLTTARLGSSALATGDEVQAVGHLDEDWDWTEGSVRTIGGLLRHSAEIGAGFSGGPVANAAGEVVGVNLQRIRGVARAMPIEEAMLAVRAWIDSSCLNESPPPPTPSPPPPTPSPPPPEVPAAGDRLSETIVGVEYVWRYVPADTFQMGSPDTDKNRADDEKLHQVRLTRGFWMAETELTQAQWQGLVKNNPSRFSDCPNCPLETVNWFEAVWYANELSDKADLESCYELLECNGKNAGDDLECENVRFKGLACRGYRLPTEAEWEYAARAGTTSPYSTGENLSRDQANYGRNVGKTVEVRSFPSNDWDLYEVHGNVWEWVWDWLGAYKEGEVEDPLGPPTGSGRVARGGSWISSARDCRSADRGRSAPGSRGVDLGFRLVRTYP